MEDPKLKSQILGGILGLAVGDALGVPVEFTSRESLRRNPVTEMRGYGTHNQPPGTWSDDTSLTLCLLESLAKKGLITDKRRRDFCCPLPDYHDVMQRFLAWIDQGEYTAHGKIFDVGITTSKALQRFRKKMNPIKCGGKTEQSNGNGSLMRILPMALYFPVIDRMYHGGGPHGCREIYALLYPYVHDISSLTHAHKRSQIGCGLYATIVRLLLDKSYLQAMEICGPWVCRCGGNYEGMELKSAIHSGLEEGKKLYEFLDSDDDKYCDELRHYERLFDPGFASLPEAEIKSSGYVVDTLEAALWCLLNTDNYKDCVLRAVNLGEDTDTVAAVAGGLAGMFYGVDAIPQAWLNQLARLDYIQELCEEFYCSLLQYGDRDVPPSDTPSRPSRKTPPKLPLKFSYQVTDTFYAGEYPFATRVKNGIPKLQRLIDFGIKTIIDLMKEPLTKYAAHLPPTCTRLHFPTIDYTSPDFSTLKEIHTLIDEAASRGEKIYVHCKGGYDRTGVVVATYFIHAGFSPPEAKRKFYEVFVPPVRGRYDDHCPLIETKWEILEQYQEWLE